MARANKRAYLKGFMDQVRKSGVDTDSSAFSEWMRELSILKSQGKTVGSAKPNERLHGQPSNVEVGGIEWKSTGTPGESYGGPSGKPEGSTQL